MQRKRTIIISNRLPVRIERKEGQLHVIPSEGGLATGLGSIYKEGRNIWIGWPGFIPANEEEKIEVTEKLREHNLIPVFLTECEIEGYYEGFSNEVLWPIFHYHPYYDVYDQSYWNMYQSVYNKFAHSIMHHEVMDTYEIWIHDYQLMLLP